MSMTFKTLLGLEPKERTVELYEEAFTEFVRASGGARLTDLVSVPPGVRNADYYLPRGASRIAIELKQVSRFKPDKTLDAYFLDQISEGNIIDVPPLDGGRRRLSPSSMSAAHWYRFYNKFRPDISTDLRDANRQLRASAPLLPISPAPLVNMVVLLNTGDFNLSTDLLGRLVEFRVKREWRAGNFKSIDIVFSLSFDLAGEDRTPLDASAVIRTAGGHIEDAAISFRDLWVRYCGAAYGAFVVHDPNAVPERKPPNFDGFSGKIVRESAARPMAPDPAPPPVAPSTKRRRR